MRRALSMLGLLGVLFVLSGCDGFGDRRPPACFRDSFEGQGYSLCEYRISMTDAALPPDFRLAWKGPDGRPLGSLPALREALGPDARRVAFAMNAGMYHPDQRPVGLLVQHGQVVSPLETNAGQGNFYDLPNGVFWIDRDGYYHLEETSVFAQQDRRPLWATQSGPLLLRNGVVHPIAARGARKAVRNAVAACEPDLAAFVISDGPVTLDQLARYVRDHMKCADALYLDGAVSVLWSADLKRLDERQGLGPMLYVLKER